MNNDQKWTPFSIIFFGAIAFIIIGSFIYLVLKHLFGPHGIFFLLIYFFIGVIITMAIKQK